VGFHVTVYPSRTDYKNKGLFIWNNESYISVVALRKRYMTQYFKLGLLFVFQNAYNLGEGGELAG